MSVIKRQIACVCPDRVKAKFECLDVSLGFMSCVFVHPKEKTSFHRAFTYANGGNGEKRSKSILIDFDDSSHLMAATK